MAWFRKVKAGLVKAEITQYEGEEGKSGRDLAMARLKNKIRFG